MKVLAQYSAMKSFLKSLMNQSDKTLYIPNFNLKIVLFLGKPIWIDGPTSKYKGLSHLVQISFGITNLSQVEKAFKNQ